MQPEYNFMHYDNDQDTEESYEVQERLRPEREKRVFSTFILPGIMGAAAAVIFGKVLPTIASLFTSGRNLEQMGRKTYQIMAKEFEALFQLDFAHTSLWALILFGFIAGMAVRFFYSGKRL